MARHDTFQNLIKTGEQMRPINLFLMKNWKSTLKDDKPLFDHDLILFKISNQYLLSFQYESRAILSTRNKKMN